MTASVTGRADGAVTRTTADRSHESARDSRATVQGAPGWLSRLSVGLWILAQLTISRFVGGRPALGSVLPVWSLLGSSPSLTLNLSLSLSLPLPHLHVRVHSLKKKKTLKKEKKQWFESLLHSGL